MRMKSRMGANVLRLSVLLTYMYMLYVGRDPFRYVRCYVYIPYHPSDRLGALGKRTAVRASAVDRGLDGGV